MKNILMLCWLVCAISLALLPAIPAIAQTTFTGIPTVIDGDSVHIASAKIRLYGIDAPEHHQECLDASETSYRCGEASTTALKKLIGNSPITCHAHLVDRYKRYVAVCHLRDIDISKWMVQQGWALSYRQYASDYNSDEDEARQAKRGIWSGEFIKPWLWRRGKRLSIHN